MMRRMVRSHISLILGGAGALVPLLASSSAHAQTNASDIARQLVSTADSLTKLQTSSDTRRALELYRRGAELYESTGEEIPRALAIHGMGRALNSLGAFDSSLAYYRRALAIERRTGDSWSQGRTLLNMGGVFGNTGRADSAIVYLRGAVPFMQHAGDSVGLGNALLSSGTLYWNSGVVDSAFASYARALTLLRGQKNLAGEGMVLNNIGASYGAVGRADSALVFYRRALAVRRLADDRAGESEALTNIGIALESLGFPDSALIFHQRALTIRRETGDKQGVGRILQNIGSAYETLALRDSALAYYREALGVHEDVKDRLSMGYAFNNIGRVLFALNDPDSARLYFERALALHRETTHELGEGETLANLGLLYLRHEVNGRRQPARALAYFDSATTAFSHVRDRSGSDANQLTFAERVHQTYVDWTVAWLDETSIGTEEVRVRAALASAERGRAQALLNLLRQPASTVARTTTPGHGTPVGSDYLAVEADSFLAPLARSRTASLSYAQSRDTLITWLTLPTGVVRVAKRAASRDSLATLVSVVRQEFASEGSARPHREGSALRGARAILDATEGSAIASAAGDAGSASDPTSRRRKAKAALAALQSIALPKELWEALDATMPASGELLIVPTGALSLLPFAALPTASGGAPLGLRYAVRVSPSYAAAALTEHLQASGRSRSREQFRTALVVGNPRMPRMSALIGSQPLRPLPGAEREARWLAARLGVRPLIGVAATETAVRARLPKSTLIHFATHALAYSSDDRVRDSFLALAKDSLSDGFLSVAEMLDEDGSDSASLHAELVVLSACQTGLGQIRSAEGTVGLARAFLARGAHSVLVSLWSVSDEATELLMRRFYEHWLGDRDAPSKSESLRRAQRDVRDIPRFAEPRFWAAFQLVGAW